MGNNRKSLKSNIIFNFVSQIITYLAPFIVAPYLSRVLTPVGVGEYSFGYSIVYYFSIIVIFGFTSYGTRQISAFRNNKTEYSKVFWNTFWTRLIFFIFCSVGYVVCVINNVFSPSVDDSIYFALILCLLGDVLDITFLYQGLDEFKLISYINILINFIYIVSVFLCVKNRNDLFIYTILKSSIKVGVSICLWLFSVGKINKPTISIKSSLNIFKGSFVFFLPSLVMHISPSIDQTMLGYLSNNIEVSYYQQNHKIIVLVASLIYSIGPIMLSKMSYLHQQKDSNEIMNKMEQLIHIACLFMFPATAGLYSIAAYFVPAYFGSEYAPSVIVMYCFLPSIIFSSLSSLIINGYYYPSNKAMRCTIFMAISVFINIIANLFVVECFGAAGVALTSSISSFIALVLLIIFSKKDIAYIRILKKIWKSILCSVIMTIVIMLINFLWAIFGLNSNILITLFDTILGVAIYVIFIFITKDELAITIWNDFILKLRKRDD